MGRKSKNWERGVLSCVAPFKLKRQVGSGTLHPDFPWDRLRLRTDDYLKSKGNITQEDRDRRLQKLVQGYPYLDRRDEQISWHLRVAACAYAMSPNAVRSEMNRMFSRSEALFNDSFVIVL